ncbi:MAG: glycoside hydrolase [Planctomycetota bacterium]
MRSTHFLVAIFALVVTLLASQGAIAQRTVENDDLSLAMDEQTGLFTVLDKKANARWVQFSREQAARKQKPMEPLKIRKAGNIAVDGDLADWAGVPPVQITSDMVADVKNVSGDRDASASVCVMWDEKAVYLAAKVADDKRVFRDTSQAGDDLLKWWERDSLEMWIGERQVGMVVNPQKSIVALVTNPLDGCQIAVKETDEGYTVEASIPTRHFPDLAQGASVGQRVAFAVGVNDADATGEREGQIYYPKTWKHSQPDTFAEAVLADASGTVSQEQMEKAKEATQGAIRNLIPIKDPHPGFSFETEADNRGRGKLPIKVKVMLPEKGRDVLVEIEGPNEAEVSVIEYYPAPLVPEQGESWLALSPYADGLLVPLRADQLPRRWGGSGDMPFFAITNINAGYGYDCIFDTPDDARITLVNTSNDKDATVAVGAGWLSSMGRWRYTRKLRYRFCPTGGYVACAKAYREYAKEAGILKTLREKMERRPDVKLLLGAPDIWGGSVQFCQEAKAAGIERMIINGSFGIEKTKAVIDMGYLASVYDNYEDIMAGKPGRYGDCRVPEDSPLMADGKRMLGWPVHVTDPKTGKTQIDPKTGKPFIKEQFGKRCSALDLPAATKWIPRDQEEHPRNARFLDVTTATGLRECYDPNHYCTRTQDREYRQGLARYVGDELGLVLGGEHGTWWGAPYYDYWEGMQSGGFYSWPAGHVGMDLPKSREEIGEQYLKYGIGHYYRIPFWELVFGGCVVSYWYWGDSTGHLYNVAPEISYKQDLFNMLYGNPPLYWVSQPFSFKWSDPVLRERLLESYRNTCKLHEQIGFDEMLSHQWLTEDRTVQKTTFSSSTIVVVNFDEKKTYDLKDGDATYTLAPLGFFAKGPTILQYRVRIDGRDITYIKTTDYIFADGGGKAHDFGGIVTATPITVRTLGDGRLKLIRTKEGEASLVRPAQIAPKWDMATTHVLRLDDVGKRVEEVHLEVKDGDALVCGGTGTFEVVCGKEHDLPNLSIQEAAITFDPPQPKQGDKVTITAAAANEATAKAGDVPISFYLETVSPEGLIETKKASVDGKATANVSCALDTINLDGPRKIIVSVDPENRVPELIEGNNVAEKTIIIATDYARWRYKLTVEVANGKVEQEDAPVTLAVDFGKELKRLGGEGALDANSIRVCERKADGGPGQALPCQFDAGEGFDPKTNPVGEVVWLIPGKFSPNAKAQFIVYYDTLENGPKTGFRGKVWDAAKTTAATDAYTAVFDNGCIVGLYDKLGTVKDKSLLTGLIYSSGQTGWTKEEDSTVEGIDVLGNGPLRAVVKIRKRLRAGLNYEKIYTFYPRRFDMLFKANQALGIISRAYIGLEGTYEDPLGNKAKVDGAGDAEGVSGKCPDPKYYVVYAPGWAYSCVALTKFSNMTYWDGGAWGGVGLGGGDISGARMSYVLHPGQKDGAFGKVDWERLTNPPTARIAP